MSVQLSFHFRHGLRIIQASVHPSHGFATITLGENGDDPAGIFPAHPELYFSRVEDIDILLAAATKLRTEFAAQDADPFPALTHLQRFAAGLSPAAAGTEGPWPVAPGTDTTGWTDSQKLGEQPPPSAFGEFDCVTCGDDSRECGCRKKSAVSVGGEGPGFLKVRNGGAA